MVTNMAVVHNILNNDVILGGTGMIKSEESFTGQLEMAA